MAKKKAPQRAKPDNPEKAAVGQSAGEPTAAVVQAADLSIGDPCPFDENCSGQIRAHSQNVFSIKDEHGRVVGSETRTQLRCNRCDQLAAGYRTSKR